MQSDIYTMDFSSGKTIYIYMCIWGVKEVDWTSVGVDSCAFDTETRTGAGGNVAVRK